MRIGKEDCHPWSVVSCKECMFTRNDKQCKAYSRLRPSQYKSARWCGLPLSEEPEEPEEVV